MIDAKSGAVRIPKFRGDKSHSGYLNTEQTKGERGHRYSTFRRAVKKSQACYYISKRGITIG